MKCRVWLLGILLAFSGCGLESSENLFETAQFEEKQSNLTHAKQLYQQIIASYPESDYAKMAQQRLQEMQQTNP